jgi:uncharacterized protein (DUF58 family)
MNLLHDMPALRQLRTRASAHAGFMRLPLRNKIWRGSSGDFMGRGSGSSLDFQDHRAYAAGDDPRHINWQAYARTGQYTMKLFREEVRPIIDIVLDASASMFFDERKAARTVETFYFAIDAAGRSGASARVFLLNGPQFAVLPADDVQADTWPRRIPPAPRRESAAAQPELERIPLRPQAMRIFISDLLFPGAPDSITLALAARNGRGIILAPFCQGEAHADWDGNYEFLDPESATRHLRRVDPGLLRRYLQAYVRHFDVWKAACQKHGILMARIGAEADFQRAMQAEALLLGAVEML